MSRRALALVLAVSALAVAGCGITRVDSPVSFKADHRLSFEEPDQEDEVPIPVQLDWKVKNFSRTDGKRFAVFVDKPPVGPEKTVRLRICTEGEKLPPQPGTDRKVCKDDARRIYFADDTSLKLACFEPRFDAPERERNTHTVSVILVDGDDQRIGQAVATVRFHVDAEEAKRCRGL